DEVYLAQHLRMTGAVLVDPDPEPAHVRVRMLLRGDGRRRRVPRVAENMEPVASEAAPVHAPAPAPAQRTRRGHRLVIDDPRRFGTGELLLGEGAMEEFFAARLGLEPLDELFTAAHLRGIARGRRAPVKAMLLDQR